MLEVTKGKHHFLLFFSCSPETDFSLHKVENWIILSAFSFLLLSSQLSTSNGTIIKKTWSLQRWKKRRCVKLRGRFNKNISYTFFFFLFFLSSQGHSSCNRIWKQNTNPIQEAETVMMLKSDVQDASQLVNGSSGNCTATNTMQETIF